MLYVQISLIFVLPSNLFGNVSHIWISLCSRRTVSGIHFGWGKPWTDCTQRKYFTIGSSNCRSSVAKICPKTVGRSTKSNIGVTFQKCFRRNNTTENQFIYHIDQWDIYLRLIILSYKWNVVKNTQFSIFSTHFWIAPDIADISRIFFEVIRSELNVNQMPEFVIHENTCSTHTNTTDTKSNPNCEQDSNQSKSTTTKTLSLPRGNFLFEKFNWNIWLTIFF